MSGKKKTRHDSRAKSTADGAVAVCNPERESAGSRAQRQRTAQDLGVAKGRAGWVRTMILAALAGAIAWSHWPTLRDLAIFWQENSDYSAGALVPLVAAYMIWADRRQLASLPAGTWWGGLAVLVAGEGLRFFGMLYLYGSLERLGFLLTIVGACLLVLGRRMTGRMAVPLAFLVLMFPLPYRLHNAVALPLQTFASRSAVTGLEMMGHLVTQEGNVLRLSDQTTVAVAEACSGLRMLTAFIIVAAALAFVVNRPRWQKAVVVASSIPVAILANTVRLIVTVLLFEYVGSETGEAFFHDFAGLAMIPFAWAVLMAELWVLRWIAGDGTATQGGWKPRAKGGGQSTAGISGKSATPAAWLVFSRPAIVCTTAIVLVAGLGQRLLASRIDAALGESVAPAAPLSTVPMEIGEWQGRDVPVDENVRRTAGDDDSISREYIHLKTGQRVGLYVGYMGRPRSRMGHRPDVCYPAHGFAEQSCVPAVVDGAAGGKIPSLLYEFAGSQPGGPRDLVLATYIVNGEHVNSIGSANDYNTRGIGLVSRPAAYVARIQLSIRATGDREADVAALEGLAKVLCGPVMDLMPETR